MPAELPVTPPRAPREVSATTRRPRPSKATPRGSEAAAGDLAGEANAETGADLMRELDTGEGAGEDELSAPGTPGEGEGAEAGAEAAAGEGAGGQPTEDGEGAGSESGTAAAVSEEPGASNAEADGGTAGVGTGPQDEMVDPFGDPPGTRPQPRTGTRDRPARVARGHLTPAP